MINLDIPCPDTEYRMIKQCRSFNLIYPADHPLSQAVRADMTIRLLSFDDSDYMTFIKNPKEVEEMVPVSGKFYEISYIRECRLLGVTKHEWENNFGPNSPRSWLSSLTNSDKDSLVKVINVKNPSYSLKELNFRYGRNE